MKIKFHVFRTKLVGGGTAYDVFIPQQKNYHPITETYYAREFNGRCTKYFKVVDFLRTPEINSLPPMSEERWNASKELQKKAERIEYEVARKAFPELNQLGELPFLWAPWTEENAHKEIEMEI